MTERASVRRIAVGLAVAAALATSACAAGQVAETAQEKTTLDGTNVDVGNIALRGLAIDTPSAANYAVGSNPQITLVVVNNSTSDDQLISISSTVTSGWGAFSSASALTAATAPTPTPTPTDSTTAGATPTDGSTPTGGSSSTGSAPSTGSASSTASAPSTAAAPTTAAPTANATAPITLPRGVAVRFGVPAADGRVLALLGTKSVLNPGSSVSITFRFAKAGSKTVTVPIQISDSGSYYNAPSFLPSSGSGEG